MGILTYILLLPLLGALVILFLPKEKETWIRRTAVAATFIPLVLALLVWAKYDRTLGGYQFICRIPWVPSLGITYQVGVDGIGVVMLLLQGFCSFAATLISYFIKTRIKEYFVFLLFLITSVYGVFISLDLFFFYLFYEMAVLPMYPLIGIWGSTNKEYATMKLTLYITTGAVLAFVGLLVLYFASGIHSFDLIALEEHCAAHPLSPELQKFLFALIVVGFGVIASLWPFHTWSPMGYAAAPSGVSMLHAGVLKKLGAYAMIRIAINLLPQGAAFWSSTLATLAMMNILYCGWAAMAQKDMKFIVGYSSCSHMGYVLLGIACLNQTGLNGAVLLIFAHGIMAALSFALIGYCYEQTHTRRVDELGGLAKKLPFIATCFSLAAMASSGLPGFANFVSEIMIFIGAWENLTPQAIAAIFGIIITATYLLRMIRHTFFGPLNPKWEHLKDATAPWQKLPYILLVSVLVIVGFWPSLLTKPIDLGISSILKRSERNIDRMFVKNNISIEKSEPPKA
ncbi:MAG: NADH-quinone oxidoreductase subunit M [Chlamydiae bacterium]|nr:NADH-quinone oxidoreductase subunit M [Chlamydiota bacterium]MBI3266463.1 NADH-quinone oxidoreductase subunit M [Chlamydiota bacterium]